MNEPDQVARGPGSGAGADSMALYEQDFYAWAQAQPGFRSNSWERTLRTQRRDLERHLRRNPSLRRFVPEALGEQYEDALGEAMGGTGLAEGAFPTSCPFSVEQTLDPAYLPD